MSGEKGERTTMFVQCTALENEAKWSRRHYTDAGAERERVEREREEAAE